MLAICGVGFWFSGCKGGGGVLCRFGNGNWMGESGSGMLEKFFCESGWEVWLDSDVGSSDGVKSGDRSGEKGVKLL